MKFIQCMGAIYQLSNANYKKVMKSIASDNIFNLNSVGKMVISKIDADVTDMEPDEAQDILDDL